MTTSIESIQQAYKEWTKKSGELTETAKKYLPGGDTRGAAYYKPYPAYMNRAKGCRIYDVDGHEYIDFLNNYTSLIHGHAHPKIIAAVQEQLQLGTAYAAPTETQFQLARMICERVPSVEQLRYCSGGSEATMMAARAARAFTGKQKIMKIEGGYHGNHDMGEISLVPIPTEAGPFEEPITLQYDRGLALSAVGDTVVTPFNEPEITEKLVKKHKHELCALIVEPMMGSLGMIPPKPGYLQALRKITKENDVLLIFDEVITLRLAPGGAQEMFGVTPDLTAMGKIIGGGLPVGAFGGRKDIMALFDPDTPNFLMHSATFNGNPLTMAAGIAALKELTPPVYDRINALGAKLRKGFDTALEEVGIRGQCTGLGSLAAVHFNNKPITNARDTVMGMFEEGPIRMLLHLCMLRRGIYPAGRQMYVISTPMTEAEVNKAVEAFTESLQELKPLIQEDYSHLLR
ncbi:aspartate aminotransferase family protein [Candidatus Poribacteria bacterium]|nr:aspartate aminotransferase family protein [Candidatus Poribacteria bacterium]